MVGTNSSIGIGVIANKKTSGSSEPPITVSVVGANVPYYDLPKPAKGILLIKNRLPQLPIIDYTHNQGEQRITFLPDLEDGDNVQIIPFY